MLLELFSCIFRNEFIEFVSIYQMIFIPLDDSAHDMYMQTTIQEANWIIVFVKNYSGSQVEMAKVP